MDEKRSLQVGKTQIGEMTGTFSGQYVKLKIYYGNYAFPPVNGEYIHLKEETYLKMLQTFLESEQGKLFKAPTQDEVNEANLIVVNRELAFKKKREEQAKAEENVPIPDEVAEESKREETLKPVTPEYITEEKAVKKRKIRKEELDDLTLMYKKQANILTVAVIFLVLVVALQALLNLYLLTR